MKNKKGFSGACAHHATQAVDHLGRVLVQLVAEAEAPCCHLSKWDGYDPVAHKGEWRQ